MCVLTKGELSGINIFEILYVIYKYFFKILNFIKILVVKAFSLKDDCKSTFSS